MSRHLDISVRDKTRYLVWEFGARLIVFAPPRTLKRVPTDQVMVAVTLIGSERWVEIVTNEEQYQAILDTPDAHIDFLYLARDVVNTIALQSQRR